jgi:hypothetical protein
MGDRERRRRVGPQLAAALRRIANNGEPHSGQWPSQPGRPFGRVTSRGSAMVTFWPQTHQPCGPGPGTSSVCGSTICESIFRGDVPPTQGRTIDGRQPPATEGASRPLRRFRFAAEAVVFTEAAEVPALDEARECGSIARRLLLRPGNARVARASRRTTAARPLQEPRRVTASLSLLPKSGHTSPRGRRDSNAPGAIASCGCAETSAARPFREPATRLHPCDGGSGGLSVWGGSLDDCRPVGARCTARFVQWQAEALRCCSVVSWWAGAASDESEALALSTREEGPVGNGRR